MPLSRRALILAAGVAVLVIASAIGAFFLLGRRAVQPQIATLVFAEFGPGADHIFTAPATDPARRTQVMTIEHADGWGISAAPRAARDLVAFQVLPPTARGQADTPAELWILDVRAKTKRLLASDADLRVAPVLSPDGTSVLYRSSTAGGTQAIVRVDVSAGSRRVVHTVDTTFGVFPIGIGADSAVLFASLGLGGTDIYRLADGKPPALLRHASDQIARDWRLSPDGRLLSYLAPEIHAERVVHRAHVIDVASGTPQATIESAPPQPAEQYSPVWTPDSRAITVGREPLLDSRAGTITLALDGKPARALAAPERGFDAPLAWSADGGYLAATTFSGASSAEPGTESIVVLSLNGGRYVVSGSGEITVLGWVAGLGG
ncbi:MAG: hypothetical protein DWI59_03895 [Chloroflexi bacterium]|nr:MAG: hypothetical protein DWI59_03895 [Chloroflexota bacterium]